MYKSLCLDYGESYFALLVYDNSSIFFNYGCQKYIEMINKPKVGIDTFLDRFKKILKLNNDPMLNGNILYWEFLHMDYRTNSRSYSKNKKKCSSLGTFIKQNKKIDTYLCE